MSIFDRTKIVFQTPMGPLLITLLVLFIGLVIIYLVIQKIYKYDVKQVKYFYKLQALVKDGSFFKQYKHDFFGRKLHVTIKGNDTYEATLFFSTFMNPLTVALYKDYHEEIVRNPPPFMCSYELKDNREICLCLKPIESEKYSSVSLGDYYLDKQLSEYEIEWLLASLAKSLSHLHTLLNEQGKPLYHGFLLPRSIFLIFDSSHQLQNISIRDHGFSYAIGHDRIFKHYDDIQKGKKVLEPYYQHSLIQQWDMLPPEQKDPSKFSEIGPQSDYYMFARLAGWLFSKGKNLSQETLDFALIPSKLESFISLCLKKDSQARPSSFVAFMDFLDNPEGQLSNCLSNTEHIDEDVNDNDMLDFNHLHDSFQIIKSINEVSSEKFTKEQARQIRKELAVGQQALKEGKWILAKEAFFEVITIDACNAIALSGMAIAYYEEGNREEAENYYRQAKKIDPYQAKYFRSHVAFRV